MNNTSPLVPQGSILEQKSKTKSNLVIAVFTILSIHVVLFAGLLMQGCHNEKPKAESGSSISNAAFAGLTNFALPTTNTAPEVGAMQTNLINPTNYQSEVVASNTQTPADIKSTETTDSTPSGAKEYTVAKGDSLYKIAKDNGVSTSALINANPKLDPKKLQPGMKVTIPAQVAKDPTHGKTGTGTGTVTGTGTSETSSSSVYTVKSGDTLTKIANSHGVTVKALNAANGLKSQRLHVGQKLKIPAKAASPSSNSTTNRA